jgi:hypothetical protein
VPGREQPLWDRFWSKVDQTAGLDACWPWRGAKSAKRRGRRGVIQVSGRGSRVVAAARVALALSSDGNWDPLDAQGRRLEACHRCHNGGNEVDCCNPRHLYWGTREQNVEDWRANRKAHGNRKAHANRGTPIREEA